MNGFGVNRLASLHQENCSRSSTVLHDKLLPQTVQYLLGDRNDVCPH
jgi:hypothetical protein